LSKGTKRAAVATESEATITRQQSEATVRQAEATGAQVALTKRQVEEGHRPVVVPQILGGIGHGLGLRAVEGILPVPLKNIGLGPALNVRVSFSSPPDVAPQPIDSGLKRLPGIGVSDQVTAGLKTILAIGTPDFLIELIYDDVAGASYMTTARWDSRETEYRDIITRRAPATDEQEPSEPTGKL
jgi:hypothetical protein